MYMIVTAAFRILSNVLLSGLTPYVDETIRAHQCGFRRKWATDQIFCTRHI